jgi:hypothetical protein
MRRTILVLSALLSCFRNLPALAVETTLYVGKHFEVRDHDQPTKYVFNGNTRIARITGSLSTNTRIQRFRLYPAGTFFRLPLAPLIFPSNSKDPVSLPRLIPGTRKRALTPRSRKSRRPEWSFGSTPQPTPRLVSSEPTPIPSIDR